MANILGAMALCLRPLLRSFVGVVVVVGALLAGCRNDCPKGQSVVELRLPPELGGSGWVLDEYCVDDECLPADKRQIGHDKRFGGAAFYSYHINVRDRPDTYNYRVKLTAPDGRSVVSEGEVETSADRFDDQTCISTTFSGRLIVRPNGRVTT